MLCKYVLLASTVKSLQIAPNGSKVHAQIANALQTLIPQGREIRVQLRGHSWHAHGGMKRVKRRPLPAFPLNSVYFLFFSPLMFNWSGSVSETLREHLRISVSDGLAAGRRSRDLLEP